MPPLVKRYWRKLRRAKGAPGGGELASTPGGSTSAAAPVASQPPSPACSEVENTALLRRPLNVAFQEAWMKHLKEFEDEEERKVWTSVNQDISIEQIHAKLNDLDRNHKATSISRKVAEPTLQFLRAIETLMAGVTIAIQQSPNISSLVVGAVRVIINAAVKFGEYFERLTEILGRLRDDFDILEYYAEKSTDIPSLHKALVASYGDILAIFRKVQRVFLHPEGSERSLASSRMFVCAQWSPFEHEYGKIMSDFEHHKQILRDTALVKNLNYGFERQEEERREQNRRMEKERTQFLSWVSEEDPELDHERIHSKRYLNTGEWLLSEKGFERWLTSDEISRFWCFGQAGIGKSVLASVVVEDLTKLTLTGQRGLAFYYCKWNDTALETMASRLVATFIKQLCKKMTEVPSEILAIYNQFKRDAGQPKFKDYTKLFFLCVHHLKKVFLVIDALDECVEEQRKLILDFIQELTSSVSNVKVFVTSRWERAIDRICVDNTERLEITAYEVQEDIARFVDYQVPERLSIANPDIRAKVIHTLTEKADGLFLWIELQLEDLSKVPEGDLIGQLDLLPTGLDAMYIRMLRSIKRMPRSSISLVRRCLLWITYAKRLLSGSEFKELIALTSSNYDSEESSSWPPSYTQYSSEDISNACFGLVKMDIDREPVRPIHYSMQEFFASDTAADIPSNCREFFYTRDDANLRLAISCIQILLSADTSTDLDCAKYYCAAYFDSHIRSLTTIASELERLLDRLLSKEQDSFAGILALRHPCPYPPSRATRYCMGSPRVVDPSFFIRCTGLDSLPQVASRYPNVILPDRPEEYLHLSCYLGLLDVVKAIIASGVDLDYKDQAGYTALECACMANRHDAVQLLLDSGASAKADPSSLQNPVIRATERKDFKTAELLVKKGMTVGLTNYIRIIDYDDVEMVRLIIEKGSDINLGSDGSKNPLFAALEKNFFGIIRLLIDKGVDINSPHPIYGSALGLATVTGMKKTASFLLQNGADWNITVETTSFPSLLAAASYYGNIDIMKPILENGADINVSSEHYTSPLGFAAKNGQTEAMKLLLAKGAEVNIMSSNWGSPLVLAASSTWNLEAIELLLENGADVNILGGKYASALEAAAYTGDLEAMELLLKNGADTNVPGGQYGSALGAAIHRQDLEGMKLLLKNGANVKLPNVKFPGRHYGSTLAAAAYVRNIEAMELLLEHGADTNVPGGEYGSALGTAIYRRNLEAMKLLLKNGADVNIPGGSYGSALGVAAYVGRVEAMELLFEHGADVTAPGAEYGCPLGVAAYHGKIAAMRFLLEKGAKVDSQEGFYGSPLGAATCGHSIEAIEFLLEKGADINAPGGSGGKFGTPLCVAAYNGPLKTIQFLLDKGADVNASGGPFGSPLGAAVFPGNYRVVELLCENGADVNAPCGRDGKYSNSMEMAKSTEVRRRAPFWSLVLEILETFAK